MNKLLLILALPLLSVSCSLSQGKNPSTPFVTGMHRASLGVNQFESSTRETPTLADVDTDALRVNFAHGWFVRPDVEVGGMIGYTDTEIGATNATMWTADVYGRYYWDNRSQMRPWVQAFVGIGNEDNGTTDDDLVEYGLGAGISHMFTASTSIDLGLEYRMQSFDNSDVDVSGVYASLFYSIFYGN